MFRVNDRGSLGWQSDERHRVPVSLVTKGHGFFLEIAYHTCCKNCNFSDKTLSRCYANLMIPYEVSDQNLIPGNASVVM